MTVLQKQKDIETEIFSRFRGDSMIFPITNSQF